MSIYIYIYMVRLICKTVNTVHNSTTHNKTIHDSIKQYWKEIEK
jgi:hypothetical protein